MHEEKLENWKLRREIICFGPCVSEGVMEVCELVHQTQNFLLGGYFLYSAGLMDAYKT